MFFVLFCGLGLLKFPLQSTFWRDVLKDALGSISALSVKGNMCICCHSFRSYSSWPALFEPMLCKPMAMLNNVLTEVSKD